MKKATIQISFPAERLQAVQHYAAERGGDLTAELEDALQKLYERIVPKEVRAYLEVRDQEKPPSRPRPARQTAPASPLGSSEAGQSGV